MNLRLLSTLPVKSALAALLMAIPVSSTAAARTGEPPEGVEVTFFGTPVTDPMGNVVGVTIPLKRAGKLFLLEGTIDQVTGNFILDTGASGLVLNKTYFRNAICVRDEEGGGVTGSIGEVCRTTVKNMKVSDLSYQNIAADVTPLGHLENRRGVRILGLFGMNMMKNLQLVIDLRNNELQLFKLDRNGIPLEARARTEKFDLTQEIEEFRNIVFVKATIGGKVLDFCLDTGAESNVISINAHKKVLATITITGRSSLNGVGSAQGEVLYGTLNDFVLGTRQMKDMETILCSLESMAGKYGFPIDGMLGYDFFAKGKICINLVKKEMGICLRQEEKP